MASPPPRKLRVFVSSTFRDMAAEREELIKYVFPALRRRCAERAVTWGEVDLRWGITEVQQVEGKVLPICLDVIQRCQPYFIGILGERYGSVPNRLPPNLVERETWLAPLGERSITELEILRGVLNNPEMCAHAYFYLRNPAHIDALPVERQADYREASAESRRKLTDLKARIRASGFPVREDYRDAKELGELVLADFTTLIDTLFPENDVPDPLVQEAALHDAFAESRSRISVGRVKEFARLDAHAASDDPPLTVIGASGLGKSALLASWVVHHRAANPTAHILEHYIGATAASTDWVAMLRRIIADFSRRLDLAIEIPDGPDALKAAFGGILSRVAEQRRIVLVIDALNQLDDTDQAPDLAWLPETLPPRLRLIMSTLPGRAQDEIGRRRWPTMTVPPLARDERAELIATYFGQYAKSLAPDRVARIADAAQTATPLYLQALLEELRVWGDNSTLDGRISHYLAADDVPQLYQRILERYEGDYDRDRSRLVGDALGLIWCARHGLSEAELLDLLGDGSGDPLPHATWAAFYLGAENALTNRSGLLGFGHEFLRDAVALRYLPSDEERRKARRRLATYFAGQPLGPRQLDELPWQLAELEAWGELNQLLGDLRFLHAAWIRSSYDVRRAWARVEAQSTYRMADRYRAVIRRPAEYLGPEEFLWTVMHLLISAGHHQAGLHLADHLSESSRLSGAARSQLTALSSKANILFMTGELDRALALYDECTRLAADQHLPLEVATMLGNRATILRHRGDYAGAIALYEEQERLCRENGNRRGAAAALGNKAVVLRRQGDLDGAQALYSQAERINRELGDRDAVATELGNQAVVLISRGDLDGAMGLLRQQEQSARELGNKTSLQLCLGNQVSVELRRGDHDEALRLCRERERICREIGDKDGLRATLGDQAIIFGDRGHIDRALDLLAEEEGLCRELDAPAAAQKVMYNRATMLFTRGNLRESRRLLEEQETICRRLGEKEGLHHSLVLQAAINRQTGDFATAIKLLGEAEQLCRELGDRYGLQSALGERSALLLQAGHSPEIDNMALQLLEEQEQICRELGYASGLQAALGNRAEICVRRGQLDAALALHEEEEQLCRTLDDKYSLQVCLGNQANLLARLRRYDLARDKFEEQRRICRLLDSPQGLAAMLTNYGMMLAEDLGRPNEALPLIEEAYSLATAHGLSQLAQQIRPALDYVRHANR